MNNLNDSNNKNKNRVNVPSKMSTKADNSLKPNTWRQDKAKVMKFINDNPYIIRKKIIKIIPKTRKNTWKEIKEDLKRQYLIEFNRRKNIREQKQAQKSKPIDFIQSNIFTEPKEENEPYYPDIEEDLFNQFTRLEEEAKALEKQHEQEILNSEIEKIKNADIAKDGLRIKFNEGEGVNFNNLKKVIRDKLNSIDLNGIYIQVSFLTPWNIVMGQTYAINSERGRKNINNILRGKDFKNDNYIDEDFEIETSGMNKNFSYGTVSVNQITEITFINQRNIGREIKNVIYADNGGSFYPYKINEKFKQNHALIKKLKRYQIFTNLKRRAFKENCLVYAMRQTNLFSEAILNNMRSVSYSRYIDKKNLTKFGKIYNIKFYVVKYFHDEDKFKDITKGKKFFGSDKEDALKIKLALIDGHYILNEPVEGVSTYYIKNYDDIEDKCQDMNPADKFKISAKNKNYVQNKARYHEIKSYEFVKFMTSDKKPWSFDELNQLKINLYDFSNPRYDLNYLNEDDYDLNDSSDEDEFYDYLNHLSDKDYYKYLYKKDDEDNLNDSYDEDYEELNEYINEINYSSEDL